MLISFANRNRPTFSDREFLTQWDYGQELQLEGLGMPSSVKVEFEVIGYGLSKSMSGVTKDSITTVSVPNEVLEVGQNLSVHMVVVDEKSATTEYTFSIPVRHKAKAVDYIVSDVEQNPFDLAVASVKADADRVDASAKDVQSGVDIVKTASDTLQKATDATAQMVAQMATLTQALADAKTATDGANKASSLANDIVLSKVNAQGVAVDDTNLQLKGTDVQTQLGLIQTSLKTINSSLAVNIKFDSIEVKTSVNANTAATFEYVAPTPSTSYRLAHAVPLAYSLINSTGGVVVGVTTKNITIRNVTNATISPVLYLYFIYQKVL